MKRLLCAVLCAVVSAGIFTGCGDSSDSEEPNIAMEEFEYGATMRELADTNIRICFDSRFFSDDSMRTLSEFFYAIQTKDTELFSKTQNPDYADYLEKNSGRKLSDYMEEIYQEDKTAMGDGFVYSYIEVTNAADSTQDSSITQTTELMDSIYKDNGKDKSFSETVKDAKYAQLSITAEANGNSYTNTSHKVYVFECEDGTYIFD